MSRFESYSKKLKLFFIAFLLPALVVGCGNWKGGGSTGGGNADSTKPAVIATGVYGTTGATSGATGLPINRNATATFSEAMDPATINGTTFTLVKTSDNTPVAGVVDYIGVTATFNPDSDLAVNTEYTATITTGAKDLAGNSPAANYVWRWTTGATADNIAPTVTLTDPVDLNTNIPLNQKISATFSEEMKPATITTTNFTVNETAVPGINLPGTVVYDAITRTATFTPQNPLKANTNYTVRVTNNVTDLADNPLVVPSVVGPSSKPNPWTFTTGSGFAPGSVALGSAGTFGIMATSATTSTGPTQINGDVALSPGTSQGIPPAQVNGVIHVNDAAAAQAKADLLIAYNFAKALPPGTGPNSLGGGADLSGLTLPPGTYTSATTILINGPAPVTLDGGGNQNAVWVFQIGSSLTTVTGSVSLTGGAQAKNVFWVPTAAATIGTNTIFNGTIMAGGNVTANTGATINGRILAGAIGAGTVALDSTTVNVPAP